MDVKFNWNCKCDRKSQKIYLWWDFSDWASKQVKLLFVFALTEKHKLQMWIHWFYLQRDGESNEVDDHFLVGQLDGQNGEGGEEQLKVFVDVIFLFAAQIDVTVELLAVLQGRRRTRSKERNKEDRNMGTVQKK